MYPDIKIQLREGMKKDIIERKKELSWSRQMKRITLDEIEVQYRIEEYQKLYEKIMMLIQKERIKPVLASGKNGKKPALYREYWILEEKEDNSQYIRTFICRNLLF